MAAQRSAGSRRHQRQHTPVSERLTMLKELRQHMPNISLLLTKADLFVEAERTEVISFIHYAKRT